METPAVHNQSTAEAKRALRSDYRALRKAHAEECSTWRHLNRALGRQVLAACPPRAGLSVFVFLSLPDEVDTSDLVDAYVEAGGNVLVPVIEDKQTMLACRFPGWGGLCEGVLGIRRPRRVTRWSAATDLVLVPALAFTAAGDRLGYGGGYYDRWLEEHPEALRVGVCLDFQLAGSLPVEPHDVGMDLVVTNIGAHWTHRRSGFRPRPPLSC